MAIASLGIEKVVYGVSYKSFQLLTPSDDSLPDYEELLEQMRVTLKLVGPVNEDRGMHVFEYWSDEYNPLEELISEMKEIKEENLVPG